MPTSFYILSKLRKMKININGIHSKFKNVRKSKDVRRYHSNQVAWQRSANKDASFFRTSDILKLSYILELRVIVIPINIVYCLANKKKHFLKTTCLQTKKTKLTLSIR